MRFSFGPGASLTRQASHNGAKSSKDARNIMQRQRKQTSGRGGSARRSGRLGMAAVELALCIPVLFAFALGAVETCNVVYVRTRMYSAAYEAARMATRPGTSTRTAATSTAVTDRCSTLLTQLGVRGGQVTLTVADYATSQSKSLAAANPQDLVTVSITAPLSQNAVTSAVVVSSSITLGAQATLIVE